MHASVDRLWHPAARGAFGVIAAARANPKLYGHVAAVAGRRRAGSSFVVAGEQFANALHLHVHIWPDGHDFGYWNVRWNVYLGFYAHALATCR